MKSEFKMILILIILALCVSILFIIRRQYYYWANVNIPSLKAQIPFGNLKSVAKKERSFGLAIYDIYRASKEQMLGIYLFFQPAILVRDSVLVKNIMTTDFQYFHDRGVYNDTKRDSMSGDVFSLEGEEWKVLRSKLTCAFTSGKLKGMFENINSIGDELIEFLQSSARNEEVIDIRDMSTRYVADCLASVVFGQNNISCIKNPNHEFRMNAVQFNANKVILDVLRRAAVFVCPGFLKLLRLKSLPKYMRDFCLNMVTKTIEYRESNNQTRKDLIQCLIQLRNNNATSDEWNIKVADKEAKSMSFEQIAANVFIFYIAGFESSSSTISNTIYEITQNKILMERAKADIKETLKKYDGKLTYESIMNMKFIDLCVKETLRKYPALPILNRQCTKDYKIPDSNITIEKGTSIIISLLGMHRDENYFPNANKYDPDRFAKDRKDFCEDAYMPFGVGPRNCIAFRMGLLISKVAIVMLLKNFDFEALSIEEIEFDTTSVVLIPKGGKTLVKIKEEISVS